MKQEQNSEAAETVQTTNVPAVDLPRLVLHHVPGKIYDTGKYKWMHGRPTEWAANRAVLRELLGPCPECGSCTTNYGTAYSCVDPYCRNSANQFVTAPIDKIPDWWQTQVNVYLDGNAWCATLDGFVNLQESVAGFGDTPRGAVANLLENVKGHAPSPAGASVETGGEG
jgi:hypothetical protein